MTRRNIRPRLRRSATAPIGTYASWKGSRRRRAGPPYRVQTRVAWAPSTGGVPHSYRHVRLLTDCERFQRQTREAGGVWKGGALRYTRANAHYSKRREDTRSARDKGQRVRNAVRLSSAFAHEKFVERVHLLLFHNRSELRIGTITLGEVVAILFAQGAHESVAFLAADFTGFVAVALVQAGLLHGASPLLVWDWIERGPALASGGGVACRSTLSRTNSLKLRGSSAARCGDRGRRGCSERPRPPRKWLVLCGGGEEAADLGEPCGKGAAEDGDELVGLTRKEDPEELCDGEEVQNPHAEAKPDNEEDHDKAADPHVARCRLAVGRFRFHGRLRRYQLRAAYYTSGSPR